MKASVAIIVGLVLVVLSGIGWLVMNTKSSTETIDTSNWVTYRNEELGFELKHPEEWGMRHTSNATGRELFKFTPKEEDGFGAVVSYYKLKSDETFDSFVRDFADSAEDNQAVDLVDIQPIKYGRGPAYVVEYRLLFGEAWIVQTDLYTENQGSVWSITKSTGIWEDGAINLENQGQYDALVYLFTFLD